MNADKTFRNICSGTETTPTKIKTKILKKDTRPFTRVVFRRYQRGNDIIALFPDEKATHSGLIMSYQHVGQHAGADYYGVMRGTRPAKREEFMPLLNELNKRGYRLRVCKRR